LTMASKKNNNPTSKSRTESHAEAFSDIVKALSKDVPLMIHGSGGEAPTAVNPETVHLVSTLTAQYIEKLVDASLDSHFTFLNDPDVYQLPPPVFTKHDPIPTKPPPFSVTNPPKPAASPITGAQSMSEKLEEEKNAALKRKRKRSREEYWDEGLPMPKIKGQSTKNQSQQQHRRTTSGGVSSSMGVLSDEAADTPGIVPPIEEWVGSIGVDLRPEWIRKAHVKNAIATPSFVFPICHDTYAYGRVREIQATKRTLDPLLQDPTINEMIQTEGRIRRRPEDEKKKEDDPEDDNEGLDEDGGPVWPGLEYVLPANVLHDLKS